MSALSARTAARFFVKLVALSGLLYGALQILSISTAFAQTSPQIFDMRKSLPLEPTEPSFHDFYINAGPEVGFKKGQYVTVVRPVPVHDPVQNKQQGTLNINVARLRIIHVERSLTVARLHSEFSDEERPTLEFEAVMIGDRVDLASITTEAPAVKKKKSAQVEAPVPAKAEPVVAAIAVTVQPAQAAAPVTPAPATLAAPTAPPPTAPAPQQPAPASVSENPIEPKIPSPSQAGTDMVRVPVPTGGDQTL